MLDGFRAVKSFEMGSANCNAKLQIFEDRGQSHLHRCRFRIPAEKPTSVALKERSGKVDTPSIKVEEIMGETRAFPLI